MFTYKFTKDSGLVAIWVRIKEDHPEKEVPKLFNLREVVEEVLAERKKEAEKEEKPGDKTTGKGE